jgi:phosphoribosylformylglycinamidine synthase
LPTPVIGVLGVIDDVRTRTPMSYKESGLDLYLIGETKSDFAGSEWAYLHGQRGGIAPVSDIPTAMRLNELLVAGRTEQVFVAAHDLSQGGLAAVITEMTLKNGVGAKINLNSPAVDLLSETPGRVLVAVKDSAKLEALCAKHSIPVAKIGETGGDSLNINDATISLTELRKAFTETFPKLFS